jgi:collagenase-like PrtC family protease
MEASWGKQVYCREPGKYLLSAKDLRIIVHIPELIKAENKSL